ncbi:lactate/malate family dehydrogenase [Staphylococcus lutrae]|uniref:Lactate dehydrogenase n=1 Tax=Staphylococcus lutrae TaxID=155085 RepID=A0AAC9WIW3_9STAP|nr:lactate dehydrogenase [Staphylococcus lutrae]ARJ50535.1 lactate dehydrogenase [Staphylococcus lutrae]PNZ37437.1 lactate dehydrogenase [Staphylococcus lutrae]
MSNKLALIGLGHVGSQILTDIQYTGRFQDILLIDTDLNRAEGEALDHTHFQGLGGSHRTRIKVGTYDMLSDVDLIIISASIPSDATMGDRTKLTTGNAKIIQDIMSQITAVTTSPHIMMISNPVDTMTYLAETHHAYPHQKLIGTGTMLESSRFRTLIADHYQVDPKSVEAFVIGEHGKTTVPVWSRVRIAGMSLEEYEAFSGLPSISKQHIRDQIDQVSFDVMHKKGWTNSAISRVAVDLAEAIFYDENRILPVTTVHKQVYDYQNVAFSLPTRVNREGHHEIFALALDEEEKVALDHSVAYIKEAIEAAKAAIQ